MNLNDLHYILQHNCLIGINKAVVAGVSGGPDSLCLLDILWRLGYQVVVAHLNHGLRPEAGQEVIRVHQEALSRNLPFVQEKVDVRAYAFRFNRTIEEAARQVRYRFLFDLARERHAQAVVVGHTADDQVETVLMHLLRGSGLSGLVGMQYYSLPNSWDREIALVRPLIGIWRKEVMEYLFERDIQPVLDESNQDQRYFRNRLRHDLIPELEKYNPQIKQSLFNMAEVLRGDEEIIQKDVDYTWMVCCVEEGAGYLGFAIDSLMQQPVGLQRRIIRRGIKLLVPGLRDIDFKTIDRCIECVNLRHPGRVELMAGLYILIEDDLMWLATRDASLPLWEWPQMDRDFHLDLPGEHKISDSWVIRAEILAASNEIFAQAEKNSDQFQAWIDADLIMSPLHVRRRQKGDCFQPLGMGGHSIKLSDIMINQKIPARARQGWPIIVSGEEIIWVPGYRIGEVARLRPSTRRVVYMQLQSEALNQV